MIKFAWESSFYTQNIIFNKLTASSRMKNLTWKQKMDETEGVQHNNNKNKLKEN